MATAKQDDTLPWADCPAEAALDPLLPIIDTHHHMWVDSAVAESQKYPKTYALHELVADIDSGHNVRATVYLEGAAMYRADGPEEMKPVGETEFANGIAAMSASGQYGPARVCAGIVGFADLMLGDRVAPVLEAHIHAGGDRFRGIRARFPIAAADPTTSGKGIPRIREMLTDRNFRAGVACLKTYGLVLDVALMHPDLPDLVDLAHAVPDVPMVLNHIGQPLATGAYAGKGDEVFAAWKTAIAALATCPNIVCKLGGFGLSYVLSSPHTQGLHLSTSQEFADLWQPYVDVCIAAFGADRCMFESGFPVDKRTSSYGVLWNAFKRMTASRTPGERVALFAGTARRVYRLAI